MSDTYIQGDVTEYYRRMDTESMLREFEQLVREWQQYGTRDTRVHRALTALWYEAKSRGIRLPTSADFGCEHLCGVW